MSSVPELRFQEFNDTWKKIKLKDACDINPKSDKLPKRFSYIDLECVQSGLLTKEPLIIEKDTAPSRAQRLLQVNDILFQTLRPYQKNNYFFNTEANHPTVASTGYAQLRTDKNNPNFIYQYIHNDKFVNDVLKRCTGTSYPAINSTDLGEIEINIPSLQEQQKISNFFSIIDSRIEIQEKIIESIEEIKKGYMQKIFSQEIRFKDENGENYPEWEDVKLGDIGEFLRGSNLAKDDIAETGQSCVLYGELYTRYKEVIKKVYSKTNLKRNNFVYSEKNDLLFPSSTTADAISLISPSSLNEDGVILGGDINIFRPKKNVLSDYLSYYINGYKKNEIAKLAQGITIIHIYNEQLKDVFISLPTIEEQQKIASFLSTFDEKLETEEKILETLKDIKKGLLQRMFV